MDAERFDALLRMLTARASRRGLFSALTSGLLGALPFVHDADGALAKRKKRKGKKKKRRRCTPKCAGKTCGNDGCGGSCGSCGDGTCSGGACVCSGTLVFCQGTCVPGCIGEAVINPLTCECCQTGPPCETDAGCCSGICQPDSGGGPDYCLGRNLTESCDFDAQCYSTGCPSDQCPPPNRPLCRDRHCACPDGLQPCDGSCVPPCTGGNVQIPGTCECCRRTGQSCSGITQCCSENCISGTCVGLPYDYPCEFDEQCASEICTLGFCDTA